MSRPDVAADPRLAPLLKARALHAHYKVAREELRNAIAISQIGDPVMPVCMAAPGAGKTHLLRELLGSVGGIAVEVIPAASPVAAIVSVVDQLLVGLHESTDGHVLTDEHHAGEELGLLLPRLGRTYAARLLAALALCREYRPAAIYLDESHNLYLTSERARVTAARFLKLLCDKAHVPVVHFAKYDFIDFMTVQDDTSRRWHPVELARYDRTDKNQKLEYFAALKDFITKLGRLENGGLISPEFDPWDLQDSFFDVTRGCVGSTHKWLAKAAALALVKGRSHLTEADLVSTRRTVLTDPDTFDLTVQAGEARFRELRAIWDADPAPTAIPHRATGKQAAPPKTDAQRATTPRPLRPFERSLTPMPQHGRPRAVRAR